MIETMRKLIDKMCDKLALTLLARADERLLHPNRLLLEQAQREAADYVRKHMSEAIVLRGQADVLDFALSRMPARGSILEFGVAGGTSICRIAAATNRPVHGFDTFTGMPEDWGGRHEGRGHYSTGGLLPAVPANVTLFKGLFEETLPQFLSGNGEPAAFIHIDCDLYSSTATVLRLLTPRITAGTVLVFDEYFNYPTWQRHEFKAFQEFVAATGIRYRYLCWGYQQVAVLVD